MALSPPCARFWLRRVRPPWSESLSFPTTRPSPRRRASCRDRRGTLLPFELSRAPGQSRKHQIRTQTKINVGQTRQHIRAREDTHARCPLHLAIGEMPLWCPSPGGTRIPRQTMREGCGRERSGRLALLPVPWVRSVSPSSGRHCGPLSSPTAMEVMFPKSTLAEKLKVQHRGPIDRGMRTCSGNPLALTTLALSAGVGGAHQSLPETGRAGG